MKTCFAAIIIAILCWPEAGVAQKFEIPPDAANMPKRGAESWCRQFQIRMAMQTNLNGDFVKRHNEEVVDFQDLTTEAIDPSAGSFRCRGVVGTMSNTNYRGTFNAARNEKGDTVWWWVDDQAPESKAAQRGVTSTQPTPCLADQGAQTAFITAIESGRTAYSSGQNDFQRGLSRSARAKQLCAMMGDRKVANWIATVKILSATSDGQGVLGLEFEGKGIEIRTALSSLTDLTGETFVRPNTPIFDLMRRLQPGQCVRFSGEFLLNELDCLKEGSVTLKGAMTSPEFIFRFTKVELLPQP